MPNICLLTKMKFDLRKFMLEYMDRVRSLGARRLYYPSMIAQLLRTHHVEEEPYYDQMIPVL